MLMRVVLDANQFVGDQHLLRLDPWHGIRIVRPAVFLETELEGVMNF